MNNFLNSPAGPMGQAGQVSTSTMPQNLFNNAGGFGSKFGQGLDSFQNKLQSFGNDPMKTLAGLFGKDGMLGNLFGGDGGMMGGMFGPKSLGGIPGNLAKIPGNLAGIPGNVASIFNRAPQAPTGTPGAPPPSGGGGFLSRFMPRGQ